MPLAPGVRLGPYEIVTAIGAGGMGEVYRARDTRLGRDVAIKVLSAALVGDPDRVARFEREAQVLASLNHPNIAHLYGFEEGPTAFLVMELVEGPTLVERITGALPLADILSIARQIAEALETAHDAGVIHRDLKPANVKVKDDGTVKVLDFGLAKALAADPAGASIENSPTLTARATQLGVILGTAAYMSPEQAKGKTVDRRADMPGQANGRFYDVSRDGQRFVVIKSPLPADSSGAAAVQKLVVTNWVEEQTAKVGVK